MPIKQRDNEVLLIPQLDETLQDISDSNVWSVNWILTEGLDNIYQIIHNTFEIAVKIGRLSI